MMQSVTVIPPKSYMKKCHQKPPGELDCFINTLKEKLTEEWKVHAVIDNGSAGLYKVKFDEYERRFLNRCNIVLIVACHLSEKCFIKTIEKLINTCKNPEKLKNFFVLSLDKPDFPELSGTKIGLIYFGNNSWKLESVGQWTSIENAIKCRISESCSDKCSIMTESEPIPIPSPAMNRSKKIKHIFNSLPTKFDIDLRRSLKNISQSFRHDHVPDIEISDSKDNSIGDGIPSRRNKEDKTKLSLNSLFKRRSKRIRDSGLSMDSSASTNSRKSDIMTTSNEMSDCTSPNSLEKSNSFFSAILIKEKPQKAKVEIFKSKAHKVMYSPTCFQSPENKRRKCHIEEALGNVVKFSKNLMTASADISLLNQHGLSPDFRRGQSEPPQNSNNHLASKYNESNLIKSYSWNDNYNNDDEYFTNEPVSYEMKVVPVCIQPSFDHSETKVENMSCSEDSEKLSSNYGIANDIIEEVNGPSEDEDISHYSSCNSKIKDNEEQSIDKCPSDQSTLQRIQLLDRMIEQIQQTCEELKIEAVSGTKDNGRAKDLKDSNSEPHELKTDEHCCQSFVREENSMIVQDISSDWDDIDVTPFTGYESITTAAESFAETFDPPRNRVIMGTQKLFRNPFFVSVLFATAAYTAPNWMTFIPHHLDISNICCDLFNNIIRNDIVQYVPNAIISGARVGTVTASRLFGTIGRGISTSNIWFGRYGVVIR